MFIFSLQDFNELLVSRSFLVSWLLFVCLVSSYAIRNSAHCLLNRVTVYPAILDCSKDLDSASIE
jgi:hypothetical protein